MSHLKSFSISAIFSLFACAAAAHFTAELCLSKKGVYVKDDGCGQPDCKCYDQEIPKSVSFDPEKARCDSGTIVFENNDGTDSFPDEDPQICTIL